MNNRVYWGAVALAVAAMFAAATIGDAARRLPNRDGGYIAGHDGSDQQIVFVDDNGNISVEFGPSATAFTVGGAAADDAAASGNPVPIGCMFETTIDSVDDGDVARVNCAANGSLYVAGPAADDAAASGNPVLLGCHYETTPDAVDNDDVNRVACDSRGQLRMVVSDYNHGNCGNCNAVVISASDNTATSFNGLMVRGIMSTYDGTNADMIRSVINATDSTGTGIAAAGILAQCDDTSPTATTENQFGNLTRNCATGALKTERDGDLYSQITAAAPTATVVKSGAGRLHKICINTPAANAVVTVYDNTAASGTVIAILTQPAALLSSGANCAEYDLAFGTGLTVNTATAAQNITVTYR